VQNIYGKRIELHVQGSSPIMFLCYMNEDTKKVNVSRKILAFSMKAFMPLFHHIPHTQLSVYYKT